MAKNRYTLELTEKELEILQLFMGRGLDHLQHYEIAFGSADPDQIRNFNKGMKINDKINASRKKGKINADEMVFFSTKELREILLCIDIRLLELNKYGQAPLNIVKRKVVKYIDNK